MILFIILLVLIILVLALMVLFSFYVFLPSIEKNDEKDFDDAVVSNIEKNYKISEEPDYKVSDNLKAIVMCGCHKEFQLKRTLSNESHTCFMAKTIQGSGVDCKYACIGLGDCAKVCPQQAISIVNNTAVVSDLCCGCGKCLDVCPQHIIKLIPKDQEKIVLCNNLDTNNLTSCSARLAEVNVDRKEKKGFKIWSYCYRILRKIR